MMKAAEDRCPFRKLYPDVFAAQAADNRNSDDIAEPVVPVGN